MIDNDIKHWRDRMGLTQQECGDILGISRKQWNKMERGHIGVSKRTVMACLLYSECKRTYKKFGLDKW